ncbi:MAG: 30S ribosomal protein S3 [Legionellales bacterium]|nr:30S ribosomal protein S3 [Legionellales bacterium]
MGQKVHPYGIRLTITTDWKSKWYAEGDYAKLLAQDIEVRRVLKKKLYQAGVSRIVIQRLANQVIILIHTARPGVIIGKKGGGVEELKTEISNLLRLPVHLKIEEVRKPDIEAVLVAENVAQQIQNRVMFRRAMKRAVTSALRSGAQGIKICVSGRLGGAEIARSEWYREGRVPLHTFRADVDYGTAEALTTYGIIGVKVWIFKGEVMPHEADKQAA